MVKTVAELAGDMKRLKLGFDRKAWIRKHLKKKINCARCGSVVCRHMIRRHWLTNKCIKAAAGTCC